jgi:hypothetical protein
MPGTFFSWILPLTAERRSRIHLPLERFHAPQDSTQAGFLLPEAVRP